MNITLIFKDQLTIGMENRMQNMYLSFPKNKQPNINCSTTSITSGAGTADPSTATDYLLWFEWGLRCSIFSFLCSDLLDCHFVFCFLPLYYLSVFDFHFLITPLMFFNIY